MTHFYFGSVSDCVCMLENFNGSLSGDMTHALLFSGMSCFLCLLVLQRESWDLRYVLTHDELGSMERLAQKVQTTSLSAAEGKKPLCYC